MKEEAKIDIYGAKEHNLKDIDLSLPRNQLIVFTGLSGSGKSSLAFDTLFAEGQRRYIETFSAYVRQFIGGHERPNVDKIDGLCPVISIEQKTSSKSPRSTVGTITELYDFFRLLFARVATAYSMNSGLPMVKYSDQEIATMIHEKYGDQKIAILAPKIRARKGHYSELFEQVIRQGYTKVRVDGKIVDLKPGMKLDRYKTHDIEVVVDRFQAGQVTLDRVYQSVVTAMKMGESMLMVMDWETGESRYFSRSLMCPASGISYPEPEPNLFSFNSPYGACTHCSGLGEVSDIALEKIIPDFSKSIQNGGIAPLGELKHNWFFDKLQKVVMAMGHTLKTPLNKFTEQEINLLFHGNVDMEVKQSDIQERFDGIVSFLLRYKDDSNPALQRWVESFMQKVKCPNCKGYRLKQEALHFKIGDTHLGTLSAMDLIDLSIWVENIEKSLEKDQLIIAEEIIKEIRIRLKFILDVGLGYLSLDRSSKTLSGGEAQRIRLATQIGTELMNVLYILDEPSIGLHQRDNSRLIRSLKQLRDAGNTVLVVEHDREMIESADYIVDIGPGAGVKGGDIVFSGNFQELLVGNGVTADYFNGKKFIAIPTERRKGNGNFLKLKKATGNTLKNVDLTIPLGTLTCITGVSGSGKSSLISQTLYPILLKHFYHGVAVPLPYGSIEGLEHLDKVIDIDQSPIGRTPRSNPVTYTKVFDEIRSLFASLPEAQIRGYKPGRFSFNVAGGKCETCNGGGLRLVEMNFLPDVYVTCETCQGKRYNTETLEVKFKGKSISDVLNLSISEAIPFFESIPKIHRILQTLGSVGLGYITLGQPSTTLSGGEAQRIKLSAELAKRATGKTLYLLDEPSTGLHFEDIRLLLDVLHRLVDEGNTVVVIEHNLDIIKTSDYIIDLGPEGGKAGGKIIAEGSPETLIQKFTKKSSTAHYLKAEINDSKRLQGN
ncbi:MAG: excinuclease ABC subunit UvrA [Flavobacteriia bacterium]|nr:excinuclease ABC subunit UvrA [Flavobacteriia bacterium]NBV67558.1 excinuclease ABC subunit UvrA [Flavobacteriia bacterium]NBV90939.1 excinuclease ABC subunit UvrA [Flavobacteriia bacterium]NBY39545.1 excinuclease ABC subunit UvrA [Flavobacteriia bacterium]